jgi:RNA polymerase sigma-70 factor (ECF subfamily)
LKSASFDALFSWISTTVLFVGENVIAVMTLTHQMEPPPPNYVSLRSQLIGYCIKKVQSKHLAEDLAQEALTRYLDYLQKGKVIHNPRAWLFQVVRNLITDEHRARRPYYVGNEWGDYEVDPNSIDADDSAMCAVGDIEVSRVELMTLMPRAVAKLNSLDRRYLDGYYKHGKTFKEFSCNEGISLTASKGRMYRARHRLREQLEIELAVK